MVKFGLGGALAVMLSVCSGSQLAAGAIDAVPRPTLVVALGDSITYGFGLAYPAQESYAAVYARHMHARLVNLAVPGYKCVDVLQREVPKMPSGAAIVILNCGTNDIGGFGFTPSGLPDGHLRSQPAIKADLREAEKAFARVLSAVRRREAGARILVFTVRHFQRMTNLENPQFAADVDEWNAFIHIPGARVIDIAADRRLYEPAAMQSDLIHPSLIGNNAIVGDMERDAPGSFSGSR